MKVSEVLRSKNVTGAVHIRPTRTLQDLAGLLAERKIGAVMVVDEGGALCGVISERDIVRALGEYGADCLDDQVAEHMTAAVKTATPNDDVVSVLERMTEGRFRHMPVLEERELVGVVSIGDIVKRRIDDLQRDNAHLQAFIQS